MFNKRRVPRKYLRPRPMQSPARLQHPFWSFVPLELVACLVVGAITLLLPLRPVDDWLNARLLQSIGSRQAPDSVIVVTVSGRSLRDGSCAAALDRALSLGEAAGALLIPPVDQLCDTSERLDGHHPIVVLPKDALHRLPTGEVAGFRPRPVDRHALAVVGIERARWVAPRDWRSIPSVVLADLAENRVPRSVVRQRLAVVTVDDPMQQMEGNMGPLGSRVAAAAAAALQDRRRAELARGWAALFALLFSGALFLTGRWRQRRTPRLLTRLGLAGAGAVAVVSGLLGHGYLLPVASTSAALFIGAIINALPSLLAARRADTTATELLTRATSIGTQATHHLSDSEFWAGLARRVAQAHPAEGVLVAELPPFAWRLRVHSNGDLTEAIISERRRDIRRTPYIDDSGKRTIRIKYGFVAMKEVPTVLVPLESQGEVEGFIFLMGKPAERAFLNRPALTEQLASDVTQLIRNRRLERYRSTEWRRPGGVLVEHPSLRALSRIEGARDALDRLEIMNRVLTAAPVGLLYADSFGDVRVVGEAFANHLGALGVKLPKVGPGGSLPAGAFQVREVLDLAARASGEPSPALDEIGETPVQYRFPLPRPAEPNPVAPSPLTRSLVFSVRRFNAADGPGFVASLVEVDASLSVGHDNIERLPERGDPLTVFSLAQLIQDVVSFAARRTHGSIKLQTPRVLAHVVGHRRELATALEEFLIDAATGGGKHADPILTVRERQYRVELTIMDLGLGTPAVAVKRTLLAPSQPPPGLITLGNLARAVENSQGTVSLRNEEGWGLRLTLSLVRAKPRIEAEPTADLVPLPRAGKLPNNLS